MTIVRNLVVVVQDRRARRLAYLLLAIITAILIFFPRPYVARAKIVPQDTSASAASTTSLLGALGSGSQSIGSLLSGGRPSNDLYLIIGRSETVATNVIKQLNLVGPGRPFTSDRKARLWLERKVDVHLLLGGVMEIQTKLYDPETAKRITIAYAQAISSNLASFGQQIINNKRKIVEGRVEDSTRRVAMAEARVNAFRRTNSLAEPEQQFGAALSQRTGLEGQLQAKQLEYQTMSQVRGPESVELATLRSQIAGLQQQIARASSPGAGAAGPNLAEMTRIQFEYLNLYRDLRFQQAIYDIYRRSAEQVAVEELAAESASYIQVIDPAGVAPERQYNVWAIAAFALVVLLALFTEWYAPATGLFGTRVVTKSETRPVEEFA